MNVFEIRILCAEVSAEKTGKEYHLELQSLYICVGQSLCCCFACVLCERGWFGTGRSASFPYSLSLHWLRWYLSVGAGDCSFPGRSEWCFGKRSCYSAGCDRWRNQKGKNRKWRSAKKDCGVTENMNTHFRHLCSDHYKEVAKALSQSSSPISMF